MARTREATRRTFSLNKDVSDAIDEYAEEHGMNKSQVVESACREFFSDDQLDEMETKIDQILDMMAGNPAEESVPSRDEPKKKERKFDPTEYDPDTDQDKLLSLDEIHLILDEIDNPQINPAHIGQKPRDTGPRTDLVAAVVRWKAINDDNDDKDQDYTQVNRSQITDLVVDVLEIDRDYALNKSKYPSKVLERLVPFEKADTSQDPPELTTSDVLAFPTETDRYNNYKTRFENMCEGIESAEDMEFVEESRDELKAFVDRFIDLEITSRTEINKYLELADERLANEFDSDTDDADNSD